MIYFRVFGVPVSAICSGHIGSGNGWCRCVWSALLFAVEGVHWLPIIIRHRRPEARSSAWTAAAAAMKGATEAHMHPLIDLAKAHSDAVCVRLSGWCGGW